MIKRQSISIKGCVQGVGFRPNVYRLATSLGLTGFVCNDTAGVTIELQGLQEKIEQFISRLKSTDKPPMAQITACDWLDKPVVDGEENFVIAMSNLTGDVNSQVSCDIAACDDCLAEMRDKKDFRFDYPFINCTNCGPRYSIIKNIPYDRANTTMSVFGMCDKCSAQYGDVADRRFHAQPVACSDCGPEIFLQDNDGHTLQSRAEKVITRTAQMLAEGKIIAIKGLGGFHLAVDALNEEAVRELRKRKRRDCKPFAVMTDSIEKIKKHAVVDSSSERILKGAQSPIVLLQKTPGSSLAPAVAEGVDTIGFMLCYTPLHYLLFEKLQSLGIDVLVMTSGNMGDEPLICQNDIAVEKLGSVADTFLMHNREIHRQVDDSIVAFVDDCPALLRRARGYVPGPVLFGENCDCDIFAAGADMKNTFCFLKQNQLICSEHIGDLENAEVYHHYIKSIEHLRQLFEVEPKIVVADLHPGYFSAQYADRWQGAEILKIQHHWAHAASVLAEHNFEQKVIALIADGTGFGTDGAIWGCECLIASLDNFQRFGHLAYYSLAGADLSGKEAVRPVLGLLMKTYAEEFELKNFKWLLDRIEADADRQRIITQQIQKQINCVETSSLGRVFDAVAAITGLGGCNDFEAQLPMALEAVVAKNIEEQYDFELIKIAAQPLQLDLSKAIKQLICDVRGNLDTGIISAKFHNCIAAALLQMALKARQETNLDTAVLSGGVFCNRYLANRLIKLLRKNGFNVLFNQVVPSNDGGISLGQAAIAAKRMISGKETV